LVRKRPLDHDQFIVELQGGSWNKYRGVLDATGPLGFNGALRGRLIATYQSNHYFYDRAYDKRLVLAGVIELDLSRKTLLTGGVEYTRQDSLPVYGGVPRYMDGSDIGLPRSTCYCFQWQRYNFQSLTPYAQIEQAIGDNLVLKAKVSRPDQNTFQKVAYLGAYDITRESAYASVNGTQYERSSAQTQIELTATGSFKFLGNMQKFAAGYAVTSGDHPYLVQMLNEDIFNQYLDYSKPFAGYPAFNIFNFNPNFLSEPGAPTSEIDTVYLSGRYAYSNAYVSFDFVPLPFLRRLHFLTAVRWSGVKFHDRQDRYCTKYLYDLIVQYNLVNDPGWATCNAADEVGKPTPVGSSAYLSSLDKSYNDGSFAWPPQVKIRYDATDKISIFGGYNSIYTQSNRLYQQTKLDVNGNQLLPTTGSNIEGGIKYSNSQSTINGSLSVYRTETYGGAVELPASQCINLPADRACVINAPRAANYTSSKGVDLELSGELSKGLQLNASLNYNENKSVTDLSKIGRQSTYTSNTAFTIFPKIMYKLWASYSFSDGSFARGVSFLLGVQGQSSSYFRGSACPQPGPVDFPSGQPTCLVNPVDYAFTVPARAILSIGGSYKLSDRYMIQFNVDNVLDKTYYQSGGTLISNWYGAPRNVTITLTGKF